MESRTASVSGVFIYSEAARDDRNLSLYTAVTETTINII